MKPQLTEPQQPATAEVQLPGDRGHCICQTGGSRQSDQCQGLWWGHCEKEHILTRWDSALSSSSSAATESV